MGVTKMNIQQSVEYQLFPATYFSGCDVSIYFGDIWIDEINSLEFRLTEKKAPIYGYNSYTWDAIALGSRMVSGSFVLNFREAGYLNNVLKKYSESRESAKVYLNHLNDRRPSSEEFRSTILEGKSLEELSQNFDKLSPEDQKQAAEIMQQLAWGGRSQIGNEASLYKEASYFKEPSGGEGFNIVVTYGAGSNIPLINSSSGVQTTFHKIVGVHLVGVTQHISPDGAPVFEEYAFMAKDLN